MLQYEITRGQYESLSLLGWIEKEKSDRPNPFRFLLYLQGATNLSKNSGTEFHTTHGSLYIEPHRVAIPFGLDITC